MGQVLAHRYELGAPLGAGGMARVVEARDLRLDRRVAVKLVPITAIDASGRARFVREAQSSARFSHPNAVAIYDAGESDGYLYLVMELVDGPSLASRLSEGPLEVGEALHVAGAVLAALGAAHAAGIVHRDVKPGNVLLGPARVVKLADFGIAKRLADTSAGLTDAGQFVGTPKYLAPEQVVGEPATPATDLYAAGVVLYEMLAGRPPYEGDTPLATAIAHRDAPIPDLRRARPDVPEHVAAVVRRAMAKDPAARFRSAAEMATALADPAWQQAGTREPTTPEPTRVMAFPPGSIRRRRWPIWSAVVAGLVAGGGVAVALAQRGDDPNVVAVDSTLGAVTSSPTSAPVATVAPTAAPTTQPATTTPPTTSPPPTPLTTPPLTALSVPATLDDLIRFVEADPDGFGSRSSQFLDKLREVEDEHGRKQSERADELLREMDNWVSHEELSFELGQIAGEVLAPLADGPGNGNGGEDDEDDDD